MYVYKSEEVNLQLTVGDCGHIDMTAVHVAGANKRLL